MLTPTAVGAGLVMCASAGLLTVVLTGQQRAPEPTPAGDGLASGPADPASYTRNSAAAPTQAPGTAAAPRTPPTVRTQLVNGPSGAGLQPGGLAGARPPAEPPPPWRSPTVLPVPPAPVQSPLAAGTPAQQQAGPGSGREPSAGRVIAASTGPEATVRLGGETDREDEDSDSSRSGDGKHSRDNDAEGSDGEVLAI